MKLEREIKKMMKDWPSLAPNRESVLEHLYCTLGNGYDWVDGELVEWEFDNETREHISSVKREKIPRKYWTKPEAYLPFRCYPLCDMCKLCTIPNNVKDDWLQGAFETIELILKLPPVDDPEDVGGRGNVNNIVIARKLKKSLSRRFAKRLRKEGSE